MNKILEIILSQKDETLKNTLLKGFFIIFENNLFLLKQSIYPIKPLGDFSSFFNIVGSSNNLNTFIDVPINSPITLNKVRATPHYLKK